MRMAGGRHMLTDRGVDIQVGKYWDSTFCQGKKGQGLLAARPEARWDVSSQAPTEVRRDLLLDFLSFKSLDKDSSEADRATQAFQHRHSSD